MGIANLKDRIAPKSACVAEAKLAALDPKQREIVDGYIEAIRETRRLGLRGNPDYPNTSQLEADLNDDGISIPYKRLAAHVNGECPCGD